MSTLFEAAASLQRAGVAEELLLLVIRVTLLLLVSRLLLAALPRAKASTRYVVATVALAAALLLPVATALVPSWQAASLSDRSSGPIGVSDTEESSLRTAISLARVTGVVPERPLTALDRATELVTTTWQGWIAILVMTPSVLLLLHMLFGAFTAWRSARGGTSSAPLSPTHLVNRAAVAVYWFHPLAWSIERQASLALEAAKGEPQEDRSMAPTGRGFGRRRFALVAVAASLVVVPLVALRLIASSSSEAEQSPNTAAGSVEAGSHLDVVGDLVALGIAKAAGRDALAIKPSDGDDWYERGWIYYKTDRHAEAAAAFTTAAQMNYREETSLYNAACSYSLAGNSEAALSTLQAALAAGWDDIEHIGEDSDLDPLRDDPRFARILSDESIATARLTNALARFEELQATAPSPQQGEEWLEVGGDLLSLRRDEEAFQALQQALDAGHMSGNVAYNVACHEARRGELRNAMIWLDRAIENGFSDKEKLKHDSDLAAIRNDPAFAGLVSKSQDLEMRGCCESGLLSLLTFNAEWDDAVDHHREVAAKYPDSGRAWFNFGYTALQARDFPAAQQAYRRTIELNYRVGTSAYNMACAYALQKNRDAAFEWLDRSRAAGFDLGDYLTKDRDLRSLRDDPRWDRLVAETKREKKAKHDRVASLTR